MRQDFNHIRRLLTVEKDDILIDCMERPDQFTDIFQCMDLYTKATMIFSISGYCDPEDGEVWEVTCKETEHIPYEFKQSYGIIKYVTDCEDSRCDAFDAMVSYFLQLIDSFRQYLVDAES